MILQIILALIIVWLITFRWKRRKLLALYKQIQCGFTWLPIIGHSYKFIGNPEHQMKTIQMFARQTTRKGGVVGLWHAFKLYIMITDPVAAECVLKTALNKDDIILKVTQVLLGNGSIFAAVPIWRPRRKILAPTFNPKQLNSFVKIFSQQSIVLTDQMKPVFGKGPVSMWKYFNTYAMDSISETTMGVKVKSQNNPDNPFLKSIEKLFELAATRIILPWLHTDFVYKKLPYYKTALKCKSLVCDFVDMIIQEKRILVEREQTTERGRGQDVEQGTLKTFMDLLIQSSNKDTIQGYTDLELREETLVLLVAGSDTSAVASAFTMVMMSRYPDVQEKVFQELQEVFGDTDRPLDAKDLPHLKYVDAVLKETLRLYPPVPIMGRKVENDVTLPSGVTLVEGCGVVVNIWGINRNPQYWGEDAELFRPERFIEATVKHPAAFMTFSHGPRSCLGYQYVMMSMKTAIVSVLRRYKVLPVQDTISGDASKSPLRVKFEFMMRHVDNYTVQLELRS